MCLAWFAHWLATAIAARIAYHADSIRVSRQWSAIAGVLFIAVAWYGAEAKGERRHMQFYYQNLYVSSFYASWAETLETLWRGALLEAAPKATAATPAFSIPTECDTNTKPPHIILIHQESVVQPSLFKQLSYDHAVDQLFLSADSNLHQMRVETYGGASWLTEFSLLAGVSTHSFGGMRQFVQTFTQNKLKDTLPQALERCGYRNVVFYPMMRNFVSNDKFYTSIGLREIFDMKSQGAATAQERDRFYYDNSLAELDRHIQASRKPMFLFLQTMSAHWPYDFAFSPEVEVSGGGPGTEPEMHEYLRRVSIAKMDFDHLMAELPRRFPGERFLVVHYGDHHPMATRMLLGFNSDTQAEDVAMHPELDRLRHLLRRPGRQLSRADVATVRNPGRTLCEHGHPGPRGPSAVGFTQGAQAPDVSVQGSLQRLRAAQRDPGISSPPDRLRHHGGPLVGQLVR